MSFRAKFPPLLNRFEQRLKTQDFFQFSKHAVVIAVSGGVDSIVLLDLFDRLREKYSLFLSIAHVNYRLRGNDSDQDALFVRNLAELKRIPFYLEEVKEDYLNKKTNFQESARLYRYRFFLSLCKTIGARTIATGHQANDDVETFLLQLIRGTGISGLGMSDLLLKQEREDFVSIIRPMLEFTREEIVEYAKERGLIWREDASNQSNDYLRNRFRNIYLAQLQKENPKIIKAIQSFINHLKKDNQVIHEISKRVFEEALKHDLDRMDESIDTLELTGGAKIARHAVLEQAQAVRLRIYRFLCEKAGLELRGLSRRHFDLLDRLLISGSKSAIVALPRGYVARVISEFLWVGEGGQHLRPKRGFFQLKREG